MVKGDKIEFLLNSKYLRGEIVNIVNGMYIVDVLNGLDAKVSLNIYESQVVEITDQSKTGSPEEWCKKFRLAGSEHEDTLIYAFTNGQCFTFADWLCRRLYGASIMYLTEEYHYVTEFGGDIFDITGNVTEKYKDCERREAMCYADWIYD